MAEEALASSRHSMPSESTGRPIRERRRLLRSQGRLPGPDALGRAWQLGTVQLDYQMPERFELEYVGADGEVEHRPVMIHRAMLGSIERFMGILIEHTAGAFPVWLAPVQAVVLPVSEKFATTARGSGAELAAAGIRVELDRAEREARLQDP